MTAEKEKANELIEDTYQLLKDTLDVNSAYTYCKHIAGRICDELISEHRTNVRLESLKFWNGVKSEVYS